MEDRAWYDREAKLLRGGKVLKIHRDNLFGESYTEWCEVNQIHPLNKEYTEFDDRDDAKFLNKVGQLVYQLAIEVENYKVLSRNLNNVNLYFDNEGVVHEPEIFEAVMKGYHVDTTDFTINTAHNIRALEGHRNI